jgi:hypothetical protein
LKISQSLQFLLEQTEQKHTKIRTIGAQNRAIEALAESFQNDLAALEGFPSKSPVKADEKLASLSKGRSVAIGEPSEGQALAALLRHLGVSVMSGTASKVTNDLTTAVMEKKERLEDTARRLDIMGDSLTMSPLITSGNALQLFVDALHADSKTARPQLSDSSSESLLSRLYERMEAFARDIEGINIDVVKRQDEMLEDFLERWTEVD